MFRLCEGKLSQFKDGKSFPQNSNYWCLWQFLTSVADPAPEISCFEVLDVLFEGWRLLLRLGRGLGINELQFMIKNMIFFSCKIFTIFGHQNPGHGSGTGSVLTCIAGSGSALKPMRSHNSIRNTVCNAAAVKKTYYCGKSRGSNIKTECH